MPAQKYIAIEHRREAGRGAEVGFLGHEQERHHGDDQRREPPADLAQVEPGIVEEPRQHERGGDLRDLGRLELEAA
jgi:hypothetical protein